MLGENVSKVGDVAENVGVSVIAGIKGTVDNTDMLSVLLLLAVAPSLLPSVTNEHCIPRSEQRAQATADPSFIRSLSLLSPPLPADSPMGSQAALAE